MVTTTGLISWFKLDCDATDSHSSNNGTWRCNELYTACGQINQAGCFDGCSSITVANESNFDFDRNCKFSVSAWINITPTTNEMIVGKRNAVTGKPGWSFHVNSNGKIRLEIGYNCTDERSVSSCASICCSVWTHIVGTYSGNANQNGMKVYLDGALDTAGTNGMITGPMLNNHQVSIGGRADGLLTLYTGLIDEAAIWKKELTSCDVSDLYACGAGLSYCCVTVPTPPVLPPELGRVYSRGDTAKVFSRSDTARIYNRGDTAQKI